MVNLETQETAARMHVAKRHARRLAGIGMLI